jgi:hypothetical protein
VKRALFGIAPLLFLFPKFVLVGVSMLFYGKARARSVPWIFLVELFWGTKE